jgi:hypothetical protein
MAYGKVYTPAEELARSMVVKLVFWRGAGMVEY